MRKNSSPVKVLTEEMILAKTKQTNIADVKFLTIWGQQLTDISIIERMPNLEEVTLSVNKITSLKPFQGCTKLKELLLRNNQISDFIELTYLSGLENLRTLWLSDNPIAKEENYRSRVLQILPQLQKIDESEVKQRKQVHPIIADAPKSGKSKSRPRKNDAPVLTAVLSLLPELSVDSLDVVLHKIRDLTQ